MDGKMVTFIKKYKFDRKGLSDHVMKLKTWALKTVEDEIVILGENEECFTYQYASGGEDYPRGYFNPSKFRYERMKKNSSKLLKRITKRSKPTFCYVFDKTGKLLFTKEFFEGEEIYNEKLYYFPNRILGITFLAEDSVKERVDPSLKGKKIITRISEEQYVNEKLDSYLIIDLEATIEGHIFNVEYEKYFYDSNGTIQYADWFIFDNDKCCIFDVARYYPDTQVTSEQQ